MQHDGTKSDLLAATDRNTLFCWSGTHADFLSTAQAYMVLPIQQIQQSGARAWRRTVRYTCIACLCIRTTGCDDSDAGSSGRAPAARHYVTDSDCLYQRIACCCHAWSHWATLSVSLTQLSCLQESSNCRSWSDERWWTGNRSYQELWSGQFFCSMPQRLRDDAQEAPEEEMIEVAVEPEEPTLLLGPLSAGSEAKITGGHHAHLLGAHVLILPSPDAHSRNVSQVLVGLDVVTYWFHLLRLSEHRVGDGRSLLCLWSWQSLGLPTVILSRAGRSTTMRLQRMPPGISRESLCVCLLMWNCLNHGRRIAPRARTGFSTITRSLASLPGTVHRWRLLRSLNLVQIVPRLLALMMVRSQLIRSTVLQRWMTVGASSPNPSGDLNSCDGRLKHLRPKDARLEILAGDLVLKSANAVSSTDSRSDPRQPVQTSDSTRPTQFVESPAASSRSTPTSATSTPAAPRRGVKRGSQTGVPPCDPRKRPPSFWFMEDDPDDTPAPPPKVKAKPKATPRTAEAKARMMSTLLKISRANRARAVAAATEKTGAVDSPLPREPCSSVVPSCRSTLSNSNWLDGTSLRSCLMRSRWDDTGTRCVSATLPYALPPAVCRCLPHYRACLHQAADLCSRSWVDSSPWALVPLQGDTRTRDPMPEFLQAPTSPWSQSLPGLDHACLAASGLTPPPMTRHTMPVCFTHWLQGWPDVYQAGDTEPCFVCQRLPRPHADVAELTMTPAATLTTLQPAGALSPTYRATRISNDPCCCVASCQDLPGTRLAYRLSDPRCSWCRFEYQRRTPIRAQVGDHQIRKANKISRDFCLAEAQDLSSTSYVPQTLDLEAMD
eukprot:s4104_g1.t1